MREWINLFEDFQLVSKVEARGFHNGQEDLTLKFFVGRDVIGWIDYVLFDGEVSVQMIHVEPQYRRKGFGTEMLRNLQHRYPDTELDLGILTDDGAALIGSMKSREEPNGNISALLAERSALETKIASYHAAHDELMTHVGEPGFDALRDKFIEDVADWNDCHDRIAEIDAEIGNQRETKRIFEGTDFSESNPNVKTVYHGTKKTDDRVHEKMFFSSDPNFCDSYGPRLRTFKLNATRFIDTLDPEFVESFLPFYDNYDDKDIYDVETYMDRSSDTWEMVEDKADEIIAETGADGLIIYEGGIVNYYVFNTRCLQEVKHA